MKTIFGAALVGSLVLTGCTKNFEDLNTNKTKLTTVGKAEFPYLFSKAQSEASQNFWEYQVSQNLFADLYAQYFATTAPYFPSDRYVVRHDWLNFFWGSIYVQAAPQLKAILENAEKNSPEYALASIWWVWSFHRVTDYWGPIPYFKASEPNKSVPYDPQDKIYDDFFARLTEAVNTLKASSSGAYGQFDLIYSGDKDKWIRFANSLRLRLALRISKVNPSKAKTEAEAAVASGVMEDNTHDALIYRTDAGSDFNGLSAICNWNEFRMSASMESVLKGYSDPRIGLFYQPGSSGGNYVGIRNGLSSGQLTGFANRNEVASNVGKRWALPIANGFDRQLTTAQNITPAAESWFLRAEGALNNWAMGTTAQAAYEKGIEISMRQWGITDGAAIAAYQQSNATPVAPVNPGVATPALSNIPVKWGTTEAARREQIATQKWLALYPDGYEAWAEFRRTRLPKLYPVVNTDNTDLPLGTFIRRVSFLPNERASNAEGVASGEAALGGPDKASTPLWWDKN
jgi:hypothetical protein